MEKLEMDGSKLKLIGKRKVYFELNNLLANENGTFQAGPGKTNWYLSCYPKSVGIKRNKNICQCGNHGWVLFGHLRKCNGDWEYPEFDLDDWVEALKKGREVEIMEPEPRYICISL